MISATLVLIRHGESEGNVAGTLDTSLPGPSLSRGGVSQATALAEGWNYGDVCALFSSNAARALETAQLLSPAIMTDVQRLDGLHEVGAGLLEGSAERADWITYEKVYASWFEGRLHERIPGGESGHEVLKRAVPPIRRVVRGLDEGETVVVVAHGGVLRLIALSLDPTIDASQALAHRMQNAGAIVMVRTGRDSWLCTHWDGVRGDPSAVPR